MKNYYDTQRGNTLSQIEYLYKTKDTSFRGFRGIHDKKDKETKLRIWEVSRVSDGDRFSSSATLSNVKKSKPNGIKSAIAPSRIIQ